MFIASDTIATAFSILLFDQVAPVACVFVQELDAVAVDLVFLIDERALQNEEIVDGWHVFDVKCVDFFNQLLLDGRIGMRELCVA